MPNQQNLTPEYQAGFAAYKRAIPYHANPYGLDTTKNNAWHSGWLAGESASKQMPTGVVTTLEHPTKKLFSKTANTVFSGTDTIVSGGGSVVSGLVSNNTSANSLSFVSSSVEVISGGKATLAKTEHDEPVNSEKTSSGGTVVLFNSPNVSAVNVVSGTNSNQLAVDTSGSNISNNSNNTSAVLNTNSNNSSGAQLNLLIVPTIEPLEVIKQTLKWSLSNNAVDQVSAKILDNLTNAGYKITLA